jgi:hypothetical protein
MFVRQTHISGERGSSRSFYSAPLMPRSAGNPDRQDPQHSAPSPNAGRVTPPRLPRRRRALRSPHRFGCSAEVPRPPPSRSPFPRRATICMVARRILVPSFRRSAVVGHHLIMASCRRTVVELGPVVTHGDVKGRAGGSAGRYLWGRPVRTVTTGPPTQPVTPGTRGGHRSSQDRAPS